MPKTVTKVILRGLRWLGLGLLGLIGLVVAVLMLNWTVVLLTFATMTVELPNGAVVARAFDWNLHPRADLYASRDGPLLVRDIDMICWDETTIDGFSDSIRRPDWTAYGAGSFIWTKGEEKVLTSESPEYLPRARNSSLMRNSPGGSGLSGGYVGGDLILRHPERVSQPSASKPHQKPCSAAHTSERRTRRMRVTRSSRPPPRSSPRCRPSHRRCRGRSRRR